MEQHAIPQNVSSYQFKLVGDMTLKQFFQLAGGLLVALIFYSAPLIGIVKWPFVIISSILGVALAFLPLEERPLERWIFAFFKAIYEPTEYFWARTTVSPKFFQDEPVAQAVPVGKEEASLKEYLAASAPKTGALANLEGAEKGFLAALTGIFSGVVGTVASTTAPAPAGTTTANEKPEMLIPQQVPVKVTPTQMPRLVVEEKNTQQIPQVPITISQVAPTMGNEIVSTKQAMFSIDAAPPNPPTYPNVIVGQVVDENRKIVEGAIIEIRDASGRPARALRSNRAGHFITVTPLESGTYNIVTDKDGFEFTPVSFEASGQLIPPILVQGKRVVVPNQQFASPVLNTNLQ